MQEKLKAYLSPEVLAFLQNTNVQIVMAVTALVLVLGSCRIFARTGQRAYLGLLMFVPGVNLLMFLALAFGRWPAERELRALRKAQHAAVKAERKLERLAA
jgi:bacteriorhodopsin